MRTLLAFILLLSMSNVFSRENVIKPAGSYSQKEIEKVLDEAYKKFKGLKDGANADYIPALDRILDFAGEAGLIAIIHNDIDVPFPKEGDEPAFFKDMLAMLKRHKNTTIIWAHIGLGRVVRPVKNQLNMVEIILKDKDLKNVYFDISWDEVAKYLTEKPENLPRVAAALKKYPDRFLFGTDVVAPEKKEDYYKVFYLYGPLWNVLDEKTSRMLRYENYNRLFDQARLRVREWEKKNL